MKATLARLEGHASALTEIRALIEDRQHLAQADVDDARAKLRDAKSAIESAYKSGSTVKGASGLSDAESRYYQPAVHEVATQLPSLATRSGPKWVNELYKASMTLDWYIDQLKTELGEAAG